MTTLRKIIERKFLECLELTNSNLTVASLEDDVELLNSGLDSLGFAILVSVLDEELKYDPFTMMETPVYPTTYGEFVKIYEKMNPNE